MYVEASSPLHGLGSSACTSPIFSLLFLILEFLSVYIYLLLLVDDPQIFCSDVDTI
jgi:hypothetical protein